MTTTQHTADTHTTYALATDLTQLTSWLIWYTDMALAAEAAGKVADAARWYACADAVDAEAAVLAEVLYPTH